jgi:glyoxylase-like metal-dependent hydrolase (beta-lactamase superfamily II)
MKRAFTMKLAVLAALVLLANHAALAQDAAARLDAAAKAMGIVNLTNVQYKGAGNAYNFGQAVNANSPWPKFIMTAYTADVNYVTGSMRQTMVRTNPDGSAPFGGVNQIQVVSGNYAWNVAGQPPAAAPAPANVAERQVQIWLTAPGFIKGAQANHAMMNGDVITFMTPDGHKIEGTLDAQNMVVKTETWIDNPVLGDMPIVTTFSDYKNYSGIKFPTTISQTEGGYPLLDLTVADVVPYQAVPIVVPPNVPGAQIPPVNVVSQKIGDGVWYLTGGTHHSLVAEFSNHLVLIEAPLDQARATAVIAEAHKLVPNKPITYVINSHNHFDHLGGVRTAAAEGATIITPASNVAYYTKIFAYPHALNPDKLAESKKKVKVEGVMGKRVLSDGKHEIDLYVQPIDGHNDAMMLVYFPKDKILSEADAYTPGAPNAAPPAMPNPQTVQLYDEIQKLKLNVDQIAPLHGRMTSLAEMKKMIGKSDSASSDPASGALVAQGKALFTGVMYMCSGCHGENGVGTETAPKLAGLGWTTTKIGDFIQFPDAIADGVGMPNVPASSPDLLALVAYVHSLSPQ